MSINLSRAQINRLIIHRIYKKQREEDHSSVEHDENIYGVEESELDIISLRIQEAIGKKTKSFRAQIANSEEDSFFTKAKGIWDTTDSEFVDYSKDIADLLGRAQRTARPDGGFIVVLDGELHDNRRKFTIAIKAELQQAFKRSFDEETNRNRLELLSDLFLSPDKKFFKIGLIVQDVNQDEPYPNSDFTAILYDDQFQSGHKPAEYFAYDFLGFSLEYNSAFLTREWYELTQTAITRFSEDGHQRKELLKALSTYMDVEKGDEIDPSEFARRYLPDGKMRDFYFRKVLSKDRFSRKFMKDKALMGRRETYHTMTFPGKVFVRGRSVEFQDKVKVINTEDEALDELKNVNTTLLSIKGKPYSQGDED